MLEEKENINNEFENEPPFKKSPGFKDWIYRLTIFLIGFIGFEILSVVVVLIVGVINPLYIDNSSELYITGNTLINTITYTILVLIFVALLYPRLPYLLRKFKDWKTDFIGLAFGAMIIMATIVYSLIINYFITVETNSNEIAAESIISAYPIISIFVLGIFGPICEEITYRYGLFSLVKKKFKILAYVVTILLFALIHFDFTGNLITELLNLPSYIIAGLILTFTYDRFGFNASVIAHVSNNLFAIITTIVASK